MEIRVAELFAGVGGFRVGLENSNKSKTLKNAKMRFQIAWSNQWEPNERAQHASKVYLQRFHGGKATPEHSNEDIATVDSDSIPEIDVLVGGFPCQDYSVAKPRNQSKGLAGKKGVLWWEIHRLVDHKRPWMVILENVDRLLSSPIGQRGRDFAVMIATLNDLGYAVEWRVVNAADYGHPQRRRRIFIIAHRRGTPGFSKIKKNPATALRKTGLLPQSFPTQTIDVAAEQLYLEGEPWNISSSFNLGSSKSPFLNSGVAVDRQILTLRQEPLFKRKKKNLGDILEKNQSRIPAEYFLKDEEIDRWREHKGAKRLLRTKKNGVQYQFAEGALAFPDPKDKPSRTIITSEGGRSPSRFKHVVAEGRRYRRLLPIELERLSGFKDNHTELDGVSDSRRAFFIGNALVTDLIKTIGTTACSTGMFRGLVADQNRKNSARSSR